MWGYYPHMVKLLSKRWFLFAVAVPVVAWALDYVGRRLEDDDGPSRTSRWLRAPRRLRRGEPVSA